MNKNKTVKNRVIILSVAVIVVMIIFFVRLLSLQLVNGEYYLDMMNKSTTRSQDIQVARGEIVDRNGELLTANRVSYNISFDRAFMPKAEQNPTILELTEIMKVEAVDWIDQLPISTAMPYTFLENRENDVVRLQNLLVVGNYTSAEDVFGWLVERYELEEYSEEDKRTLAGIRYTMEISGFNLSTPYTFAEDIPVNTAVLIKEQGYNLVGVDILETAVRYHPEGELLPHIIGRIGPIFAEELAQKKEEGYIATDLIGKEGVELLYEDELRGEDGQSSIVLDSDGNLVEFTQEVTPVPGNTVELTIDSDIQRVGYEALVNQIKYLNETAPEGQGKEANAGAVVAIDVKTGDVLASINYPTYDLNRYNEDYNEIISDPLNPMFNRALLGRYAPGSTYKPAVSIATLNEEIEDATSTVYCGMVYTHYDDYQPRCLGFHGDINVQNALRVSCNIYYYDVGRRLGIDNINRYALDLGLGEKTGVELSEGSGILSSPEVAASVGDIWTDGRTISSAIGQGYNEFTPIQLANYTATIANRGERMDTNIIKSIYSYDMEEVIYERQPQVVVDMDYVDDEVFETVIDGMVMASRPGGTASMVFGDYFVDVASKTGTPETAVEPNSVFIAFAPADDPEIAIAVVIEKGWHGYTGAPVAKAIFDEYFMKYGEGDTYLERPEEPATEDEISVEEENLVNEPTLLGEGETLLDVTPVDQRLLTNNYPIIAN